MDQKQTASEELTTEKIEKSPLGKKLITGATYGMLAGFWAELPLVTAYAFKKESQHYWNGMRKWTARLVLPATLVGLVYGFLKPDRDLRKEEAAAAPEPSSPPLPERASQKSWVAAQEVKGEPAIEIRR